MKADSQEVLVLNALRAGPLTSKQAMDDLGVSRLAAVIHSLRESHTISSEKIWVVNRRYQRCHVAQYRLEKENECAQGGARHGLKTTSASVVSPLL